MPDNMKIDYIEFPASDLGAVEKFYSTVFNWTFESYGPEYLAFKEGRLDGGFYRSEKCSLEENGGALVIFYAEDLEGAERAVVEAGGKILKPIFSFPGGRRFQFTDPAGNELAVWTDK